MKIFLFPKVGSRQSQLLSGAIGNVLSIVNYLLLTAICLLPTHSAFAQKEIPELWGLRVHDEAHILKSETIESLEKELKVYEDSTSNQIAILIVQSLDGEVLEEYSLHVAEKWKLGQKDKDNGVLLLIAVDDHKMRIEVGQGLEGVLTDAQSNRIIRNEIAPNFRRSDFDAGVTEGTHSIIKAIGGEYTVDADSSNPSGESNLSISERIFIGLFLLVVLGIFTLVAAFVKGCAGWGIYAFLIPFYAVFPWIAIGTTAAMVLFVVYVVGMPIFKIVLSRSTWGKALTKKWESSSRSSGSSGSGWSSWSSGSSSSSWGSGSSFSGGGGSFGGGGSSGGW